MLESKHFIHYKSRCMLCMPLKINKHSPTFPSSPVYIFFLLLWYLAISHGTRHSTFALLYFHTNFFLLISIFFRTDGQSKCKHPQKKIYMWTNKVLIANFTKQKDPTSSKVFPGFHSFLFRTTTIINPFPLSQRFIFVYISRADFFGKKSRTVWLLKDLKWLSGSKISN